MYNASRDPRSPLCLYLHEADLEGLSEHIVVSFHLQLVQLSVFARSLPVLAVPRPLHAAVVVLELAVVPAPLLALVALPRARVALVHAAPFCAAPFRVSILELAPPHAFVSPPGEPAFVVLLPSVPLPPLIHEPVAPRLYSREELPILERVVHEVPWGMAVPSDEYVPPPVRAPIRRILD